jgi:hypothetical protein
MSSVTAWCLFGDKTFLRRLQSALNVQQDCVSFGTSSEVLAKTPASFGDFHEKTFFLKITS